MIKVAIFASGSGTNAENILNVLQENQTVKISSLYCNKRDAFVFERIKPFGIAAHYFSNREFKEGNTIVSSLKNEGIDYVVLAGFLLKIPESVLEYYSDKIINIHPSLLPKYGGKGMYGSYVHQAVLDNKEVESGITIHLVNEEYDKGEILQQATCKVENDDTVDSLAKRIHKLEYEYFPKVILDYITKKEA